MKPVWYDDCNYVLLCNGIITMVIKAQSPAGFAEEYIIESIWNNRFPLVRFCPLNVNSLNLSE